MWRRRHTQTGDRDPHDINVAAQDKSTGKSSQITITNKKGMDHKQLLDPLAMAMPEIMVDTPQPEVADQLRGRGPGSQPEIERLLPRVRSPVPLALGKSRGAVYVRALNCGPSNGIRRLSTRAAHVDWNGAAVQSKDGSMKNTRPAMAA